MSPEDLEKLRRLEEEVDREREASRKTREEIEAKKSLVPVAGAAEDSKLPAKKEDDSKALVTEKDANAWRRGLQKKIAVGAGGVMVAYWLMSNILTILAGTVVVAGAYYFSGKYLNPPADDSVTKKKKDGEEE